MSIKIIQIGNNLNIVFNEKRFTINVNEINKEKLYKLAFLYNQNQSLFLEKQLNKLILPLVEKKDELKQKARIEKRRVESELKSLIKNTNWGIKEGKILLGKDFYLPTEFVNYLKAAKENGEDVTPYKHFITKLANNPVDHVRNNFFSYMQNCKLKLTPSGNILAYRHVKTLEDIEYNIEDVKEINKLFIKAKINKKSPSNYEFKGENLKELYEGLDSVFTDAHTKREKYKIGNIISMPLEQADTSDKICSKGFHFTNFSGVNKLSGHFGDVLIMGIINPSKIVSIPLRDNYPKFRCIEWYFAGIIGNDFVEDFENSNISILDMDFETKEEIYNVKNPFLFNPKLKELKEKIKEMKKQLVKEQKPISIITCL